MLIRNAKSILQRKSNKVTSIVSNVLNRLTPIITITMSSHKSIKIPDPTQKHVTVRDVRRFKHVLVIGDVHGCYDEMLALFDKVGIDMQNENMLKVFVGDLVNKGPKNTEVLDAVINMPFAMSVRGNHDELVLRETYGLIQNKSYVSKPNNEWMTKLSIEHLLYLRNLPYTISLPDLAVVVVHAGLVPEVSLADQVPHDMISMRNLIKSNHSSEQCSYKATSKEMEGEPWATLWPGPEHVYFGHDAKRGLQRHLHATGLDTGCVYGRKLSAIFIHGPMEGKVVSVAAKQIYKKPDGEYIPDEDFSTLTIS